VRSLNEQEVKTIRQTCGTVCSACIAVVMAALLLALFLVSQGKLTVDDLMVVRARLGDAESSLGDAESSLGDAESSLGDV
jgi:hypothetical protein